MASVYGVLIEELIFRLIDDSITLKLGCGVRRQYVLQGFDNAACVRGDMLTLFVVDMDEACVSITLLK